jgi:hypothetical protein
MDPIRGYLPRCGIKNKELFATGVRLAGTSKKAKRVVFMTLATIFCHLYFGC